MRILVCIGAAVAAKCQPCLENYFERAKRIGIEANDIYDAIALGKRVGKGSTSSMNQFVYEFVNSSHTPVESKMLDGCGCC